MIEKMQWVDIVMQHQAFQRRAVIAIIAFLNHLGFIRRQFQELRHIGIHVPVNLRKQVDMMRIERVVEIEYPILDMGEIGFGRCAGDLGHAHLMARA